MGHAVEAPAAGDSIAGDVLMWEDGTMVPYTHFSLAMSFSRRFAHWGAFNIDGSFLRRLSRAGIDFVPDPASPRPSRSETTCVRGTGWTAATSPAVPISRGRN